MVVVGRVSRDGLLLVPVNAVAQVEELLGLQRNMLGDVSGLPAEGAERSGQIEQLRDQKGRMLEAVQNLERELDHFASGGWPHELEAGVARSRSADFIRESKLEEKLQYSRGTIEQWDPQSAVKLELSIEADLQALRDQMERAPLIYVEGMRTEMDGGTSVMWERVVRGEERGIPMSVLQSTIDSWRQATATPASLIGGIESLEVVKGDAAVEQYGEQASGGVIQIWLKHGSPEPTEPDLSAGPTLAPVTVSPTTPFTVAPSILNRQEVLRAMEREYPPVLRDAGIGGQVGVYLFIDENGEVQNFRVESSSGHQALDDAALRVARVYRFSAALNRDEKVPAWVQFRITFQVR